ncbi:MAG: hypothetical protein CGU28_13555 [Candidatus Dactylopiibacterium carminicum]|uniref:UPF0235 protein BGI27_11355 n=1 Tax=Candidatus Dactylopiibacterium carminicum TaxID=857335 RepID=A0A272ERI2_9RHOO|nr:DUF167 domain-containing protein [Candidatus Dactylopiibacterium carminicum]KAF7598789.1 hypothetical protein BGI27_11355 [Candidatus Dactylopiibacterium carminicum]PAS92684.1 MAG: hypothetical protein CGU29_10620 [Candidatus Dactylopiibacterium carminicum]PAS94727.1 MAG: hypothetical protein CGU28_13555 [Candidatus Dactylopiibacterium carminicum]PAS98810.1 MAG: hypothetical protein BSR46_11370 [Candidatus Dactylopiibacterium carminicum]
MLREHADGAWTLTLHVQPGARKTEFVGMHGDALKLRLAAPPVEGKANACLLVFLADYLDLPKTALFLQSGEASRHKVVRISGLSDMGLARLRKACAAN